MKINWVVRFKNPVWLTSFITFVLSTVYQFASMLDIVPTITQDSIMAVVTAVIQILTLAGILVDPTTNGISDSTQAMTYTTPKK